MDEQSAFIALIMSDALYCVTASAYKDAIVFMDIEHSKKTRQCSGSGASVGCNSVSLIWHWVVRAGPRSLIY